MHSKAALASTKVVVASAEAKEAAAEEVVMETEAVATDAVVETDAAARIAVREDNYFESKT